MRWKLFAASSKDALAIGQEHKSIEQLEDKWPWLVDDAHCREVEAHTQALDKAHHREAVLRVEARCDLIEEEKAGARGQRTSEGEALTLATRQAADGHPSRQLTADGPMNLLMFSETHLPQHTDDALCSRAGVTTIGAQSNVGGERDCLVRGLEGLEGDLLRDVGTHSSQHVCHTVEWGCMRTVEADGAEQLSRRLPPTDHIDKGGLACARWAHHREKLVRIKLTCDTVHDHS
mmetsp:Transcript_46782/g.122839  ORF Transcript_46782/g.122839 Transcript_46782/m.122839 type:complete len:233 (-) Transcript_46782:457-1155(-)